jgi:hypothetical protein
MKDTLKNMLFYVKDQYNRFEEDLEKHLDEEVSWKDFIPFFTPAQKTSPEENVITHKLKKD